MAAPGLHPILAPAGLDNLFDGWRGEDASIPFMHASQTLTKTNRCQHCNKQRRTHHE
jgi:hypothetical protein